MEAFKIKHAEVQGGKITLNRNSRCLRGQPASSGFDTYNKEKAHARYSVS